MDEFLKQLSQPHAFTHLDAIGAIFIGFMLAVGGLASAISDMIQTSKHNALAKRVEELETFCKSTRESCCSDKQ